MRFLLALLLVTSSVQAATAPQRQMVPTDAVEFELNRWLGPTALKNLLGTIVRQAHQTAIGVWDATESGMATVGAHSLNIVLPNKAIVRRAFFDVITQPAPSGVTLAFKAQSTADLKTGTAASSWTGIVDGALNDSVSAFIKLTAQRTVVATITGSAATAGKIKVYVDYIIGE